MSILVDGPAATPLILNERAPRFLRVVVDAKGAVDVLDQLEDTPADDELVHVYERVAGTEGEWATVTLARPKRCITTSFCSYRYRADVDGAALRSTDEWRAWCLAQTKASS